MTDQAFGTLTDIISLHDELTPNACALSCDGESVTWGELHDRVGRVAHALTCLDIAPGDKVASLGAPSIAHVVGLLGALRAGACIVPLPTSATGPALDGMLDDCGAKAIMVDAESRALLGSFEDRLRTNKIALDFSSSNWLQLGDMISGATPDLPLARIVPEDDFNIIYSSGTTGVPKGIVHSHDTRMRQALRRSFDLSRASALLLATPLYSNTTLMPMFAAMVHGAQTILMRKFDAARYLAIAAAQRVTHTMLVPVQYWRLLALPDFDQHDLSHFKLKQSTGAPLDAALKRELSERWPGRMIDVFGMTEGGTTCILDIGAHPDKLHTVGQPAPAHDIRLIDEEGRVLPPGATGEVVGRGPFMMTRYHNKPSLTEEIRWRDEYGQIFHRSGDVGRFDADGFLVLLDRKKDVIISGGSNIYASDLEAVLSQHPDVADVAVIGVPSEAWGETPLGLVARRPGGNVEAAALREWANAQLGKTQRLSAIEFRDALPRSSLGKLLKRELRAPYWK